MRNTLSPIVLFVYNRPWHTRQTLNALQQNKLAAETVLYIFADGAKETATEEDLNQIKETRKIIRAEKWCKEVIIVEHDTNYGLAKNIINGVTELVDEFGKVIVLEDDIVTSIGFLTFMNNALDFYQRNDKIMHISGYMYPHKKQLPETFFFNVPLCWGWATWKESWGDFENNSFALWESIQENKLLSKLDKFGGDYLSSQLAHNISGKLDTWFIKWHASVLLKDGFTLYPSTSLVNNIGFDNTGVHNGVHKEFKHSNLADKINVRKIEITENIKAEGVIKSFYENLKKKPLKRKPNFKKRIVNKLRFLIKKIIPEINNINKSNDKVSLYNSYLGKNCKIYPKARLSKSIIGNYTYIAENATLNNTIVGRFCSIGPNLISGWGIHPTNGLSTHPMFYSVMKQNGMTLSKVNKVLEHLPINIGNDVFIGANVTILDGVNIGNGAIIGAGAIVSKDIPAYAIAVGSPIKVIKYRFDKEIIAKLLKIKWWDYKDERLQNIEKHFFDFEEFFKNHEEEEKSIN